MDHDRSRRCFIKLAAASGGAMCLGAPGAEATVSPEERKAIEEELAVAIQTRQVRDRMVLFNKLVAKYGDGIVADVEATTIEQVRDRMRSPHIEQRDLGGVKAYLWDQLGAGFEFRVVEDAPEALEFEVSRCFLAEAVAEHGGSPALGHAFYCAWDLGFCQGLNPDIEFTRTKTLMQGDTCCNHRYVLKTPRPAAE